jgi:multimeric flavodoxin WrbA
MEKVEITAINAFWDSTGAVPAMLEESLAAAQEEARFQGVRLRSKTIHLCDVLHEHYNPHRIPAEVPPLLKTLQESEGWLIASPILWGSKADYMQTLTCHLNPLEYPDFPLRGKPFGVMVHGKEDGGRETVLGIAGPLAVDFDMVSVVAGLFYRIKDGADKSEGLWMLKNHRLVGQNLVRHILKSRIPSVDVNGWKLR